MASESIFDFAMSCNSAILTMVLKLTSFSPTILFTWVLTIVSKMLSTSKFISMVYIKMPRKDLAISSEEKEEGQEMSEVDEPIQKPKRVQTEKQKEATSRNLAAGRAKRDANRELKKQEDKIRAEELIAKKAERIIKTKTKKETQIKKLIGLDDDEQEEEIEIEERIIKKPKKKKIIYREESDSEEERIIKSKPKKEKPVKEIIPINPVPRIVFV